MNIRIISDKISYKSDGDTLQVVILGRIERWKEALLTAWLIAWIFCGAVVIRGYFLSAVREERMMYLLFLLFWAYYLWRVGRVWLFRRGGNELVRMEGDELTLKRSFFTYGKARTYQIANIRDFKPIELSKRSFAYTYENGWWVLGGEKLGFDYQGRLVKFAMQLKDEEAAELYRLVAERFRKASKTKR